MQKKNEQMFGALAICLCLCPQPSIDDALLSALSDKLGDKTGRMERGDEGAYEDLFSFSCPKFVSPCAPDYDEPGSADHQESYKLQLSLFLNEVRQAAQLPTIRTYLALYSAIDAHKLAGFVETTPAAFHAQLQTLKHKAHARVWQGGEPLSGARGSSLCGLNFAVSDQLVHVSLNRPAKRYGKRARRAAQRSSSRGAPPFPSPSPHDGAHARPAWARVCAPYGCRSRCAQQPPTTGGPFLRHAWRPLEAEDWCGTI